MSLRARTVVPITAGNPYVAVNASNPMVWATGDSLTISGV